jgi:hypothetical protein
MSLPAVKTSHLGGIGSPSGGLPDPVPPPGMTLEWESPTAALTKIEAGIAELTTATGNTGKVYMTRIYPGTGGWGPVDPNGTSVNWLEGTATPGGTIVPAYSGGVAPWTNITDKVSETGKTWFMFVNELIHDRIYMTPGLPYDHAEGRDHLHPAFRFSITPSRYRFVPTP